MPDRAPITRNVLDGRTSVRTIGLLVALCLCACSAVQRVASARVGHLVVRVEDESVFRIRSFSVSIDGGPPSRAEGWFSTHDLAPGPHRVSVTVNLAAGPAAPPFEWLNGLERVVGTETSLVIETSELLDLAVTAIDGPHEPTHLTTSLGVASVRPPLDCSDGAATVVRAAIDEAARCSEDARLERDIVRLSCANDRLTTLRALRDHLHDLDANDAVSCEQALALRASTAECAGMRRCFSR